MSIVRIGIIGCGIAGQAAAIGLARDGHEVTIVERFATARAVGAGLLLQPSGLQVLESLGVRAEAEHWGAMVAALDGRTVRGRRVLKLDYGDDHGLGIHRAALSGLLHRALLASGVKLHVDFDVAAIADFEHPVLVGKNDQREGPFDVVLDCAGAHDTLRHGLGTRLHAPLYPWGALWVAVPDRTGAWQGTLRQTYDGASLMMGVLPIGRAPDAKFDGPHVAFFWSLPLAEYETQKAAGLDRLKARMLAAWPALTAVTDEIANFDQFALATYRDVIMWPWRRGNVLVLGDAAHATSPQLGQGANLALIDAITIVHCIRKSADAPSAIALYGRMRRAHTAYYQLASRMLTPAFQSHSRVMAFLRDTFLVGARYVPLGGYLTRTTLAGVRKFPWGVWRMPS